MEELAIRVKSLRETEAGRKQNWEGVLMCSSLQFITLKVAFVILRRIPFRKLAAALGVTVAALLDEAPLRQLGSRMPD